MRRNEESYIKISGGIVTSHFVSLMQDEEHGFEYAEPQTFIRPWREDDEPVTDEKDFIKQVVGIWNNLLRRFDEKYKDINAGRISAEDVRKMWQFRILDALGFEPTYTSKQIVLSDKLKYKFSHRGWFYHKDKKIPKPPVIHILPPGVSPDERPERGKPSPQDALQDCLNRHDATWAMLMNESVIRILRDYHHTTVPGYIEFDLVGIFLNRSFPEFLALYRFCHASRFARGSDGSNEPLENYYEVSRQAGEKIGESLRENVVRAIEELGNGFLDSELLSELKDDESCRAYYQEILTVVYRIIFMLFAEQRGMLGGGDHGKLFLEEYSITSLRERTDSFLGRDDRHTDIWEGLSVTFRMLEEGVPELGVNAFDGMLFSAGNLEYLRDAKCRNTYLMNAIRELTWTRPEESGRGRRRRVYGRQRISYADLSVEEIGAIYESLLDYRPRITEAAEEVNNRERRPGEFVLDPAGSERKTTGSYYTNPDLVAELIKSALDPVIRERLSQAGPDSADREKALLSIRVCDPACGSGAFLIAASNRLGQELAKIRGGTEFPDQPEIQSARRDVLSHCIYGVDLNPMAVELAKVSMWINALVGDRPLSFLDHHVKCGNSLVGATPELIAGGIPDGAYSPVEGDEKSVASGLKKTNKTQRELKTFGEFSGSSGVLDACSKYFAALSDAAEDSPDEVERKKEKYEKLLSSIEYEMEHLAADCWCSAFFWPLDKDHESFVPTTATVRTILSQGSDAVLEETIKGVHEIAEKHRFFHWHLEFPEVFADGGFDCVLGNPPWEKIQENSDEFFSVYDKDFRKLLARDKKKKIVEFCKNSEINQIWNNYKLTFDKYTKCYNSTQYQYQGEGHLNAFKLFLEKFYQISKMNGYFGIIVQSSITNDKGCTELRKLLFDKTTIQLLYVFENRKGIFQIHRSHKFALLTTQKGENTKTFPTGFMLHEVNEIYSDKTLNLSVDLVKKFAPDTLSILEFSDQKEIDLIDNLFLNYPLLGEKIDDSWNVIFHREINQTDDRELLKNNPEEIIVFEGKMIHHYNHRYEKPKFWISPQDAKNFYSKRDYDAYKYYRLAYRAVASSTNETSLIATIIPNNTGSVESLRTIELFYLDKQNQKLFSNIDESEQFYLTSLLNSIILNYIIRKKVSENISAFYVYQLPVPRLKSGNWYFEQLVPRAARLICTTEEYTDLWNEVYSSDWNNLSKNNGGTSELKDWTNLHSSWTPGCGVSSDWDDTKHDIKERAQLRCEIDALIAHLYGLERSELEYILSTFPAVAEKTPWIVKGILTEFDKFKILLQDLISTVTSANLPKDNLKMNWINLIKGGETDQIEFKSSISYDLKQKQKNKTLEHIIAKTIAAFMNTDGGVLFAGVDDDGNVLGLENDISLAKGKKEDGLKLHFDNLIKNYLGDRFNPLIHVNSIIEDGKLFWAIEVKSAGEPVFVKKDGDEEFWIRAQASSRKLGMSETIEYIKRWE